MPDNEAKVIIVADFRDNITKGVQRLESSLRNQARKIGFAFGAMGAAAAFGLNEALESAKDFELGMANIASVLAGTTGLEEKIDALGDSMLELSKKYGVALDQLQVAGYDVVSAGITDIAQAEEVLAAGSLAAVAGLTDVGEATGSIVAILRNFNLDASLSESVSDSLFKVVKGGVTTFSELSQVIAKIAPLAVAADVSFLEMNAALATLTSRKIKTTEAATGLRQTFLKLAAPAAGAKAAMAELGIQTLDSQGKMLEFTEVIKQFRGLTLAQIVEVLPSEEAAATVLTLAQNFGKLEEEMRAQEDRAGATQQAFEQIEDTAATTGKKIKAVFEAMKVEIGTALLPAFQSIQLAILAVADDIAQDMVPKMVEAFTSLSEFIKTNQEDIQSFIKGTASIISASFDNVVTTVQVMVEGIAFWKEAWERAVGAVKGAFFELDKFLSEKFGLDFIENLEKIKGAIDIISGKRLGEFFAGLSGFGAFREDQRLAQEAAEQNQQLFGQLGIGTGLFRPGSELAPQRSQRAEQRQEAATIIVNINNPFVGETAKTIANEIGIELQDLQQRGVF